MSLSEIRDGLGANLAAIPGLRIATEIPDNPSPPIAIISLQSVSYDLDFSRGMTLYNMRLTLVVGRVAERDAQRRLDQYTDAGSRSVKTAIESDRQLNGSAFDVRLSSLDSYGAISLGEQTYLAAEYSVLVYAE
jgi:hypothetical protein